MNAGFRFSRNAATPSAESGPSPSSTSARDSARCASHGEGAPSIDHSSCRAAPTAAPLVFATISRASAYAVGSRSASGTTRETSRPRSASAASNTRPVATHSIAWLMPTTRGRNHDDAASGTIPTRAKTKPNRADSAAIRMSIGSVSVAPMPTAGPFTAAITGLRSAANGRLATPPASRGKPPICCAQRAGRSRRVRRSANVSRAAAEVGAGAERPARPVTTTTRTASSASAARRDRGELVGHGQRERVQPLRAVQRDRRDAVRDLVAGAR